MQVIFRAIVAFVGVHIYCEVEKRFYLHSHKGACGFIPLGDLLIGIYTFACYPCCYVNFNLIASSQQEVKKFKSLFHLHSRHGRDNVRKK